MIRNAFMISILIGSSLLSGCASIAEGVTTAFLNQDDVIDTRKCEVTGTPFNGIRQGLNKKPQVTKLLVVHGIQKHLPGYSTRFREKITYELGLNKISKSHKEIIIIDAKILDEAGKPEPLGILRITRHTNQDETKELLYYELTWSQISDPGRDSLLFDVSGEYSFKRAELNHLIKEFVNKTIPDLLAYRGISQVKINRSVSEATCWTFAGGWKDLPESGQHFCNISQNQTIDKILDEQHFYVTHSLGSRIVIDTISDTVDLSSNLANESQITKNVFNALKQKEMNVFMLSNQLPLLQIGQADPEIINSVAQYCPINAEKKQERIFKKLNLVAFSDPNDILSYPIPPNYADHKIDSRLCPNIINVNLNITPAKEALGLSFANPIAAHSGYLEDDRVIALIADGLSREASNPLIKEKCRWIETID